jgi:cytochrome P450
MIEFNPYDPKTAENPYPVYRQLRDHAPVYHNPAMNFWALTRHADVMEAHRDNKTYCSSGGMTIEGVEKDMPMLILKDEPEHRWHKALVTKVFTRQRMGDLEPYIRQRVRTLIDTVTEMGEFDFVKDFAVQLPLDVISEMIGIPKDIREDIHHYSNRIVMRTAEHGLAEVMEAHQTLHNIYLGLIRDRRANPRDDVITMLMNAEEIDETGTVRRMSDDELAARFGELAFAGHETVAKAIPNGAMAFHAFPDQWQRLVSGEIKPAQAVDEILRYDPPSQLQGRTTTREVTLHGVTIPEGIKIMLITGSATRDERAFEDPDRFDVGRDNDVSAIYFGYGIHRCLGIHLARLEIRVAFEELLARMPNFAIDPPRATRAALSNVRGVATLPARAGLRN